MCFQRLVHVVAVAEPAVMLSLGNNDRTKTNAGGMPHASSLFNKKNVNHIDCCTVEDPKYT